MATITGLTAERMLEIEASSVIAGVVIENGHLILTKHDGSQIDAGSVIGPVGPVGPPGPPSTPSIPGEVKMWPGSVLPDLAAYGHWVWADGGIYSEADYPIAASHIAVAWKTFGGAQDPGSGNFRVPDFRGLVPAGLDQMPGGIRANRMTRAVAITLAGKTGEETHVITITEMPGHSHSKGTLAISPNPHNHPSQASQIISAANIQSGTGYGAVSPSTGDTSLSISGNTGSIGSDSAHENVQPTVFVPYIVKLDD
jgi:microcystin-dependent protein